MAMMQGGSEPEGDVPPEQEVGNESDYLDELEKLAELHEKGMLMRIISNKVEVNEELLNCARSLDRYYVPTRYPNGFESGSPYEYFTRRDAEDEHIKDNTIWLFSRGKGRARQ
jgi:hypothetical protein